MHGFLATCLAAHLVRAVRPALFRRLSKADDVRESFKQDLAKERQIFQALRAKTRSLETQVSLFFVIMLPVLRSLSRYLRGCLSLYGVLRDGLHAAGALPRLPAEPPIYPALLLPARQIFRPALCFLFLLFVRSCSR
jgi:hypothetical protein